MKHAKKTGFPSDEIQQGVTVRASGLSREARERQWREDGVADGKARLDAGDWAGGEGLRTEQGGRDRNDNEEGELGKILRLKKGKGKQGEGRGLEEKEGAGGEDTGGEQTGVRKERKENDVVSEESYRYLTFFECYTSKGSLQLCYGTIWAGRAHRSWI